MHYQEVHIMNVEKIKTIMDDEYHYTAGYFVTNKWIDNDTFIGVRATEDTKHFLVCKTDAE